ncbi:hypothetical protein [Caulobacter segnis]|uniref:Uncharacterized protein n=1 Tax=Caulobacter segnis TaxID=88688 RepID=A0A2W5UYY8_9CAUL|nr:hypothetical protein [Caulobacter segnis]PZR32840.1 MAG: hypothetical protein DI526_15380 [Caulobacter segnis]
MYSTLDRAKKRAKDLKRVFDDSGFLFPLNLCQAAVAQAGGFRDWRDLQQSIGGPVRVHADADYRRRLLAALPWPCHAPVRAWLDKEPTFDTFDAGGPRFWYRDAYAFLSPSMRLQRRRPLLRPGSGEGQQMRDNLVTDLLLFMHPGVPRFPLVDPITLDLVYEGKFEATFATRIGHPRFQQEFDRLVADGVLAWDGKAVRIRPVDIDELREEVIGDRMHLAEHWASDPAHLKEFTGRLRETLAVIGVDDAWRVADAIAQQGSRAYVTGSGATLTLLTELAREGRLDTFARVVGLFAALFPKNIGFLREQVPAKVHANVLAPATNNDARRLMAWTQGTPDWADRLKEAVGSPPRFVATIEEMIDTLSRRAA